MSAPDQLPSSASSQRPRRRRRRSVSVFLVLLLVYVTVQTLHLQPASSFLKLLNSSWTSSDPGEPGPPPPPPPPLVQQDFRPRQEEPHAHPPPALQGVRGVRQDGGSQRERAANVSSGKLLEGAREKRKKKPCRRKSHLVFLKTHKTASSSVQNVLYRYGDGAGLAFALPRNRKHMMSYPRRFRTEFVETRNLARFDILCNHMRFRRSEVEKLMPEDSFYFSIVRHPVSMLESAFMFFKTLKTFRRYTSLDDFLDNGQNNFSLQHHFAHNSLAFDFGYDNTATADTPDLETIVNQVIVGIEKDFHLILVTEYFDESMVLLKHALCWSLEDVVSFKVNSRAEQSLTADSRIPAEKIKRWNVLDWRIYQHFNASFWSKVRSLVGEEEMKLQVSQLRERRAQLSSTCLEGGRAVSQTEVKDRTVKPLHGGRVVIQGYNLQANLTGDARETCRRMIIPELQYNEHLYVKQFEKDSKKKPKRKHFFKNHKRSK